MKIKLCGNGTLAADVAEYFTVGNVYDVVSSETGEVFDVYGDDGKIHSPAIFTSGVRCSYLEDCEGNLYWKVVE